MKSNDKVKVFAQVGLMKEPRWLNGILLEDSFPESGYLVQTSGNKVWSDKVKRLYTLDCVDGVYPKVVKFEDKNWNDLKDLITKGINNFFPKEPIVIKEEEKIISAYNDMVTISADITEVESISAFYEHPVWAIHTWHETASTRWEPADVDCKLFGNAFNSIDGAKCFIDAVWSIVSEGYWNRFRIPW